MGRMGRLALADIEGLFGPEGALVCGINQLHPSWLSMYRHKFPDFESACTTSRQDCGSKRGNEEVGYHGMGIWVRVAVFRGAHEDDQQQTARSHSCKSIYCIHNSTPSILQAPGK